MISIYILMIGYILNTINSSKILYNILPEKELVSIYNWVSLFKFPICVGRDPDR